MNDEDDIDETAEDIAAASAAHAFNVLPSILDLPAPELYRRLYDLHMTTIRAYRDSKRSWGMPPEPSIN